jgi:aminoglycoside 6'-N-acetyltransferase
VDFSFRPLRRTDFPLLQRWLAEPHVLRWWNHETTAAAVERDFGDSVDGREPAENWLVLADGEPLGLIQCCFWEDYPEYLEEIAGVYAVPPAALTIDYLIGPPLYVGRGLGTQMIAAFLDEAWVRHPAASSVVVPVVAANTASCRALEKSGFREAAAGPLTPDNPVDDPLHRIFRIDRST